MSLPYKGKLVQRAKELRSEATKQENHLWYDFLKSYPVRFQRQKTIKGFIADFYCAKANLILEVDGMQHSSEQGKLYDSERTMILSEYDIKVLRISNHDIEEKFDAVCEEIDKTVKTRIKKEKNDQLPTVFR